MRFTKTWMLAAAAALATGLGSCSKEAAGTGNDAGDAGTGNVTVSFGFDRPASTYATASTAKPTTSWQANIKDLTILFVDPATGIIRDSRVLQVPTTATGTTEQSFTMINIKAGTYTAYVLANAAQNNLTHPNGEAMSALTGRNISQVVLESLACTSGQDGYYTPNAPTGGGDATVEKAYKPAPEIFAASKTDFKVEANATSDGGQFTLTRLVSLFRVRINHTVGVDASVNNADLDFTAQYASLRIRRTSVQTHFAMNGTVSYTPTIAEFTKDKYKEFGQRLTFSNGPFSKETSSTGYDGGTIVDAPNGFTTWKDVMIFPGGAADPTGTPTQDDRDRAGYSKFDIVLIAKAPEGYVPAGSTTPFGAGGGYVAWTGAVTGTVTANNILEVNCSLKTAGVDIVDPERPVIPEPETYGNLDIQVNLAPWGSITSTDIEM